MDSRLSAVTLRELDLRALRALRRGGHAAPVEELVRNYSRLGEHSRLWLSIALAGLASDPRRRPVWSRLVRTIVVAELANAAMKRVVRRRRPTLDGLPHLMGTRSGLSYPSAHATTSFAAARVLSAVTPSAVSYGAALAMALTRPYLGVHYPSDILAGAVLGPALAELVP
ncbi:MAG: phosphatase PAP2 family protein [Gaiellaceae bacterium]